LIRAIGAHSMAPRHGGPKRLIKVPIQIAGYLNFAASYSNKPGPGRFSWTPRN